MRKKLTRVMALILAAALTVGPVALASQALGTEIYAGIIHLADGVDYTRQYLWSATYSDLRTERYIEYTPNSLVQPVVAYGDTVLSKNTLSALAQSLESQGKRVLGGINGDYYVLATGAPLGMVVTDGVLRSSSSYHYALGFDADGNAFIGQPSLSIMVSFRGNNLAVSGGLNKVRTATDGYFLYTSDFGATTLNTESGIDVILVPTDGSSAEPVIGGSISCTVEQVLHSTGAISIPEGKLILSINDKGGSWLRSELAALQPGDTVDISITAADSRWNSVVTAIGGMYKLVTNGVVESGLETTQAPRTAVGIKADGTTVFYTIDGRQSGYSVGASTAQVAARLVELGCVEAIGLDGGGSTTFGASLPGETSFDVLNSPSDGAQRAVTNALFLVADQAPVGQAASLVLSPGEGLVLPGTQIQLSATSIDAIGQTVGSYSSSQLSVEVSGAATAADGGFIAGSQAGSFTVTACADGLSGCAVFTVVTTVDSLAVQEESTGAAVSSINLEPGASIDLTAAATYCGFSVLSSDQSFTWSVTGGVGVIDQNGVFTAGQSSGTGSLTVSAAGCSVTIPVTVSNFTDVTPGVWYEDAVTWAVDNGVTVGTSASARLFSPDVTCTRAEIVAFLYRANGSPAVDTGDACAFTDVAADSWYADAVAWAAESGLTIGTSASEKIFSPNATCTRAEIMAFLYRAANSPQVDQSGALLFTDVAAGSWYADAVAWAVETGITVGTSGSEKLFSPDKGCSRAEIVTFLYRYLA